MRLTALLLTVALVHAHASGVAQNVTISGKALTLKQVFAAIEKQTGYVLFHKKGVLSDTKPVSLAVHNMPLRDLLDTVLKDRPLDYTIQGKTIILSRKSPAVPPPSAEAAPAQVMPAYPSTPPITGRVIGSDGAPLDKASVRIKGSNKGVSTDADGRFSLEANPGDILVVSFTGFQEKEVKIGTQSVLSIVLELSKSELDEVQIIAYGTTTKRLNTGDVTTITAKDIEKHPVNNVMEAVQGKVPGLFIQQVTGQPGGAFNMRLRGSANFSAVSNFAPQPLVIVDGVTYPGGTLPMSDNTSYGTRNFLQGGSGLNYINPNDIESISVLKDADATSLFGSQGAYGVILITTKKAKAGVPSLNANIYTGISVLGATAPLLNTQEYIMLRKEALKNDGTAIGTGDWDINGVWPEDRDNNFRDQLLGDYAQTTNASVSYSGGSQNSNYLVSGSLRNNGNIQRHKGASKDGSLRFALNTSTTDNKFSLGLSGTYLSSVNDMVPYDFSQAVALSAPNSPPVFLPDGSVNWENTNNNIGGNINRDYRNVTNNLLASTNIVYRPLRGLQLHAGISYNNISSKEFMGYPTTTMSPSSTSAAAQTHSIFHHYEIRNITMSAYAEYSHTFREKGDLNVKIGGRVDNKLNYTDEIHGTGFASDALLSNPSVATTVTTSFSETPYRDVGAYAILKFVWDQKYIVNLNGRRDGSTKFGPGRKFGNFGSMGLGWIFSEENFLKNTLPFLSFGKLRASTGLVGGDAVGDYAYLSTYAAQSGTYAGKTGLAPGGLSNPLLSWEKNWNTEFGLELGFFQDRIFVEGNYYRNIASNQLISQPLSSVTGRGAMPINSDAKIRNSGWEMSLSSTNIRTRDFSWSTRFNISIPTSELLELPTYRTLSINYIVGKPVTGMLLYNYGGINPETGYFSFINAKGEKDDYTGGLTDKDKTEFRDMAPKYYGGFQNSFRYKQLSLDFSITFTSRLGKNMLAQNGFPFGYMDISGGTFWLRRWQKSGDITDVPRVSANLANWGRFTNYFVNSTGAYSNATYARLQNVSIRYDFKGSLLSRLHLKDLAVYLQGQNLLTVSKYGGLDPENLTAGIIPPMRVFTAGLNMTF